VTKDFDSRVDLHVHATHRAAERGVDRGQDDHGLVRDRRATAPTAAAGRPNHEQISAEHER